MVGRPDGEQKPKKTRISKKKKQPSSGEEGSAPAAKPPAKKKDTGDAYDSGDEVSDTAMHATYHKSPRRHSY